MGWARALAELCWLVGRLDWAGRVIWLVGWHGGGLAGGTQFYVALPSRRWCGQVGWVASTNAIRTYMLREWYTKVPNGPGAAQGGPKGGPV